MKKDDYTKQFDFHNDDDICVCHTCGENNISRAFYCRKCGEILNAKTQQNKNENEALPVESTNNTESSNVEIEEKNGAQLEKKIKEVDVTSNLNDVASYCIVKKCMNCSALNDEDAVFCKGCGKRISNDTPNAEKTLDNSDEYGDTVYRTEYQDNTQYEAKEIKSLRIISMFKNSGLLLCSIIFFTVGLAGSILNIAPSGGLINTLDRLSALFGLELSITDAFYYIFDSDVLYFFNSIQGIGTIITSVPSIIIMIGLWMIYTSVKNSNSYVPLKTSGITTIKVISWLSAIYNYGLWIIIAFFSLSQLDGWLSQMFASVLMISSITAVMYVIYYSALIRSLNKLAEAFRGGEIEMFSGYISFCCFVSGIFSSIGALLTFSVFGIASGISQILFGCLISSYNNKIDNSNRYYY